jgi:hypothetical protein
MTNQKRLFDICALRDDIQKRLSCRSIFPEAGQSDGPCDIKYDSMGNPSFSIAIGGAASSFEVRAEFTTSRPSPGCYIRQYVDDSFCVYIKSEGNGKTTKTCHQGDKSDVTSRVVYDYLNWLDCLVNP